MTILGLLIFLVIVGIVFWGARTIMAAFDYPPPVQTTVIVVLAVIVILVFLSGVTGGGDFGLTRELRLPR